MDFWQGSSIYFSLGLDHILDPQGLDHLLFIVALCAGYSLKEWRQVGILVTAFTLGHSLTLALSALDIFRLPSEVIEFMIPLTILLTSLYHLIFYRDPAKTLTRRVNYGLALGFGLIHGMGFSNFFRELMMDSESVLQPLLFFNLGIEAGQLLIVGAVLLRAGIWVNEVGVSARYWRIFLSVSTGVGALWLMLG
ncbi:MAG: HupE/UreJ family protein [Bacteroidota bacterium]